ncbi:MAG TPA: hypothetical protein VMR25_21405 [Planctomycetaceae bacterium]|jgi:hypothetical protein|nr:hypothetical protein [Planctomycetaceae bacterium]
MTTALAVVACAVAVPCWASEENSPPREAVVAPRPVRQESPIEFRLAYKFRPGQDVRMLLMVGSQIRIQKGNNVALNTIQSVTERHFQVVSVDPQGSAVLDLVIDNVKIAYAINNDPPVAYDTRESAPAPKGLENVKECIAKHTRVRVDARGKLMPLDGSQPVPSDDPDILVILPEKPVRIGEEWFNDYQARVQLMQVSKPLTQKVTLRRRYTLAAVNNNVAIIRVATAEVTPVNDPQVLAGMVQLTPKGTVLLDIGQGALTLRDLHCDRTEVGVLGPASSIAGVSNTRETLR